MKSVMLGMCLSYRTLVRGKWSRGVQTSGKAVEQRPHMSWRIISLPGRAFQVQDGVQAKAQKVKGLADLENRD